MSSEKRRAYYYKEQLVYEWSQTLRDIIVYIKLPDVAIRDLEKENKQKYGDDFVTQKVDVTIELD